MIVITGATGHTGTPLTQALLHAGTPVRIISRSAERATPLADAGAEPWIGDATDPAFLTRAFTGASAVFAMIPPHWTAEDVFLHQKNHADALATALQAAGVPRVVSLSSVGTHLESGSGVVFGLRYMEALFNAIPGLHTLHLRPTYFMENTFGAIAAIREFGMMGSPIRADLPFSMIATRDIAAYAAMRLQALDFAGNGVHYLLGSRDLTYMEVAKILGAAIGKPDLPYVEISPEDFAGAMRHMGASPSMISAMNEFMQAMNSHRVFEDATRTPETTTPTSIEDFAPIFASVYLSA